MTKEHQANEPKQHHNVAPSGRPALPEKIEADIAHTQRNHDDKLNQNHSSMLDKRKEARIEHTNGSTPRRDQ